MSWTSIRFHLSLGVLPRMRNVVTKENWCGMPLGNRSLNAEDTEQVDMENYGRPRAVRERCTFASLIQTSKARKFEKQKFTKILLRLFC